MTAPAPPVDAVGSSLPGPRPAVPASAVAPGGAEVVGPAPPPSPFDPPPQRSGAAVRGGAVAIAGQGAKTAVRLIGTVVLARLLTPADFGLVAMVTVITGFVGMFTDVGLSAATVQRPRVTHEQVSTLFWLNVALGCGLAALTAASAPLIAWFYDEPRLTWMTVALAGTFVLAGLTVQHQALLQRRMQFVTVTWIGIAAQCVGTAVAVGTSWQGWGPWSLIVMSVTSGAVTLLANWACSGWLPGRPVRGCGAGGMLKFGGWLTGFQFLNYGIRNGDNLLIGAFLGAGPLGLYSRAYGLLMLPLSQVFGPVSKVALPALSRLSERPSAYRDQYRQLLRPLVTLSVPIIVLSIVGAGEIIRILLGPDWTAAESVFRILAVGGLAQPIASTAGWLFVTSGHPKRHLMWAAVASPVFLLGFAAGLPFGITGVAVAFAITATFNAAGSLWYACRFSHIEIDDVVQACWGAYALGCVGGTAAFLAAAALPPVWPASVLLAVKCVAYGLVFGGAFLISPGLRTEWTELFRHLRPQSAPATPLS
ncbi:lipopolysaccharide biosynthesis protein [Alienimonas sp. DA493]|uniref:lipopolysaccharide biosynthesis protein n=1 Tax=Alienimonas sp. DA493 TaxID=3373605 RepID=UPI0037547F44